MENAKPQLSTSPTHKLEIQNGKTVKISPHATEKEKKVYFEYIHQTMS